MQLAHLQHGSHDVTCHVVYEVLQSLVKLADSACFANIHDTALHIHCQAGAKKDTALNWLGLGMVFIFRNGFRPLNHKKSLDGVPIFGEKVNCVAS